MLATESVPPSWAAPDTASAGADWDETFTRKVLSLAKATELAVSVPDPATPGAWYDSQGEENGDKCAWTFGAPFVMFTDGSKWKIQGEWSNHAYDTQTGYSNSSGQKGCLSGV